MLWYSCLCYTDTLNTELTSKMTRTGISRSPFNLLFVNGVSSNHDVLSHGEEEEGGGGEGEGVKEGGYSDGEDEEEEEGGGEEGEQLQMEVISGSISQGMDPQPPGWQYSIQSVSGGGSVPDANQPASVTVSVQIHNIISCAHL